MNRRMFVAASAGAAAVASNAAAQVLTLRPAGKGERVTLTGWIQRAPGSGHAFVFSPRRGARVATDLNAAPDDVVLVYPQDVAAMRAGPGQIEGRMFRGRFTDLVGGHSARTVLTEARLV